jgi:hypothetical protein
MAVKGKSKSRGPKRQVTRAPKPQYTPPPQSFLRRKWVQVTGAFVAGILVVLVALWAVTGISNESQRRDRRNQQAGAASAMRQVQAALTPILSQIGQQQGPGFDAFPRIRGTIAAAQKGTASADEIALTASTTQKTADAASASIAKVSAADLLRGSGASQLAVTTAIDATDEMAAAFALYEQAAVELARSHELSGAQAKQALASAKDLDGKADALFQAAYNNYTTAQSETGVLAQPTPPPGVTGGLPGAPPAP